MEEERSARRKQDEALRVLWSEVGRLRLFQSARAAVVIQKVWRGHDDRALYAAARSQYSSYVAARAAAATTIQRYAESC